MLDCRNFGQKGGLLPEMNSYTERDTQTVRKFCDSYFWMLVLMRYFQELFEGNERVPLQTMKRAAHFFNDLSNLIVDQFLLQAAKIMDRARSFGRDNLSVYYVLKRISWPEDMKKILKGYIKQMEKFNELIREARNRILSHNDLETILEGKTLGQFPEKMDRDFLNTLGKFAELVHQTCIGSPYDPNETFAGDAIDFMKIMREADAFELYMKDNPGTRTEIFTRYLVPSIKSEEFPA
jgi:hypothetical protein